MLTDKEFKNEFKTIRISDGMKREFYKCSACGKRAANDYLPNSLSNPIYTSPCEHSFKDHYDNEGHSQGDASELLELFKNREV